MALTRDRCTGILQQLAGWGPDRGQTELPSPLLPWAALQASRARLQAPDKPCSAGKGWKPAGGASVPAEGTCLAQSLAQRDSWAGLRGWSRRLELRGSVSRPLGRPWRKSGPRGGGGSGHRTDPPRACLQAGAQHRPWGAVKPTEAAPWSARLGRAGAWALPRIPRAQTASGSSEPTGTPPAQGAGTQGDPLATPPPAELPAL